MSFANPYLQRHNVPNPNVPYNGEIPNGLQIGQQIIIGGRVAPHAQQFRIDLSNLHGHIALHINPRFNVNQIVRNTDRSGWGPEERTGPFPFRHNEPFQLVITAEQTQFRVDINGNHAFNYAHRLPLGEINRIGVQGDVQLHELVFVGGQRAHTQEVYNPSVPSSIPVPGGFRAGKLIQIIGNVPPSAGRFEIDLQQGPGVQPPNMSLHFNPRWNDPHTPQPVVIRTNRRNGGWGSEDRNHGAFPFQRGQRFEILILCDQPEWKVAVNGQHFISYPHTDHNFGGADHIGFAGDVVIEAVRQFN